ncbi:MAG: 1-acyl-sn-glycerol-3-phosphate acyltransferase, partial [Panacagrimonas sp.]
MNIFRESFAASGMALRHEARRLTRDPRILTRIESLARQLDRPLPQVTRDAESRLNEMVTVQSATHRYLWDKALGPAHTRAFTVDADQAALSRLKKLNKQYPLVILPSHRSYADPFIMAKTIVEHGLKRTHILGGDNLKFFPFAPIVRGSGGVFIRRRFGDDEIYKAMVQEYLSHLLAEGENIEWYMEGGRSRTGKLRPPKYGLLNYLVQAIKNGAARDVMLVPTSITYDQLHEVRAMAQQEISGFKPKEGLSWLLEYVRGQQKWIGEVHIRFGETISLAQRIRAAGEDTELNRYLVEKTAFEVFRQINAATPVTAQALLTLALLAADRALTLNALYQQLQHFLEYARARSLPTSQLEPLRHHHGVMDTLETLVGTQVVDRFE